VKLIKKIFWISLGVKLVLAGLLPLTSDEAYYWVWSQHLQLSYYDHPPFVSWLYFLGHPLQFLPGSVRWPGVLLGHGTLWLWLKILEPFLSIQQRQMWLLLAVFSPLVGGSAILVTPDLPLMFFYALSLWLFFKWQKNSTPKMSLLFGLSMGLGFSSKYMMVLFGLSLAPVLLIDKKSRKMLLAQLPYLAVGCVVGSLPVWLWNYWHDFASIKFQTAHGLGRKIWKPSWTIEFILAQIGLIFPVIIFWAVKSGRRMPKVFHFLAWTPLIFFLFTTSRGYVEANWPIAAYPAFFALAVSWYPVNARSLRITAGIWAAIIGAMMFIIIGKPGWSKKLKAKEFYQFDAVAEATRDLSPLYTRSYQMAAKLSFDQKRPVFKLRGMNRKDFFDYLEESEPKERVYYWVAEKNDKLPVIYKSANHQEAEVIPIDDLYEVRRVVVP
jgi:4-amino-4-deoxy-L-arabinose transferase-like glycosyltransferase